VVEAVLLDTDILIALTAEGEEPPSLIDFERQYVSSLSWAELLRGTHATDELTSYKARSRRLVRLQEMYGAGIPFDDECLEMYGEIMVRVEQRKGDPKANRFDRMIAATAMAKDLVLVTRNTKDFKMFEGILDVVER
jgi:toxin FitB